MTAVQIKIDDTTKDIISVAQDVIQKEIQGLKDLSSLIRDDFIKVVELLSSIKGRVIVTGMGKSGHIAKKISSTFASTGTPSYFVHPAEASHGDLGIITKSDAVIAISNSGESEELFNLLNYTKRFNIPLIAITKKVKSTLDEAATHTLLLPDSIEACPMGLAPTTSTTVTLALGDALAIALLDKKGFSSEEFHVFHPGGSLGKKLLRVEEIMHKNPYLPLVEKKDLMSKALIFMTEKGFGCIGVTDSKGCLSGIITDGDLRRHMAVDMLKSTVDQIMTTNVRVIEKRVLVSEALHIMNSNKITNLFVVEDEKPIGIINVHDCLRAGIS